MARRSGLAQKILEFFKSSHSHQLDQAITRSGRL